ncbi:Aste57867_4131 [Aphanomyces stellatus]|uniref:Aste57867_4131 protein n=1 Tax=Aphanomyces stellatus TaxID=120398 RepID=A0A485KC63_9STRA|nr:hypothetical protein As57867_004120 [Aphanomyces stellatus]VFT81260.1 Aste57867_4131 [Aphanomyces stellatus]
MHASSVVALVCAAVAIVDAAPCAPLSVQQVITASLLAPTGLPCSNKIAMPASANGNQTVIAEYTARSFEANAECATWWPSAAADIKAISPVCDVRPGLSTQDLAAMSFTDFIAETRLEGKLAGAAPPATNTTTNGTNGTITAPNTTKPSTTAGATTAATATTAKPTTAPSSAVSMTAAFGVLLAAAVVTI